MLFSLDVVRAQKGDCLILHFGDVADPRLMLIDGGPSSVYTAQLRPRLMQLRAARGLADNAALPIDAVNVSHIDDDHIQGILDLTRELRVAKTAQKPLFVRIDELWHNSFDRLVDAAEGELAKPAEFGAASLESETPLAAGDLDAAKVLSSIPQGFKLRDDAKFFHWNINAAFGGGLIAATGKPMTARLGKALKFTVIGPISSELRELRKDHQKWLAAHKQKPDSESALAAYVDRSVTNLSSIVLLAESEGKRMLLTGDARGDKVLEGLELAKVIAKGAPLHVDLLKVPHHGSTNDVAQDFFERVTADHYVFSGNGEHGNPERETIEMLLAARGEASFTMHFTYPIAEIDEGRVAEWRKQQEREKKLATGPQHVKGRNTPAVRPNWWTDKQSLAALFAARGLPTATQKIECMDGNTPHMIDLLDPR